MRGKRLKNCTELICLYKLAYALSSNSPNKCKAIIVGLSLKLRSALLSNVGSVGTVSVGHF